MKEFAIPVFADSDGALKLDQLPAAVRATLRRESGGGPVENIRKDDTATLVLYEAEATIGGQKFHLKIAEDGRRLAKKAVKRQYVVPLA
jgi:hypothetical protein